ncbi:PTS sugar transporter subunit IIA [Virgibacillus senegalensis]|uniref:PTS sugar transporter subunit IIA n=1 Tax=Virgibacillus senegalensis TaxID=1499679 RepID=UPI00069EC46F|nr:PTS sugar transporter subunit IIA [Virgibacillus senegalensis]
MLSEYLQGNVNFIDSVTSWEEAIETAASPLLKNQSITTKYIQDMIKNVHENGPYIVIAPGIAMPHAKNEGGVLKTGISFLKLDKPVLFPENKEVNVLFVLAAVDSSGHLDLISDLSELLIDDSMMGQLKDATSEKEVIELVNTVE